MFLGNITREQAEKRLKISIDPNIWNKYHNDKADLSGMDECFHIFDIPFTIHIKPVNKKMENIIRKMLEGVTIKEMKNDRSK